MSVQSRCEPSKIHVVRRRNEPFWSCCAGPYYEYQIQIQHEQQYLLIGDNISLWIVVSEQQHVCTAEMQSGTQRASLDNIQHGARSMYRVRVT